VSGGAGNSMSFGEMAPYAHAALRYFELGWGPLPVTGKGRGRGNGPPRGRTGRNGVAPQRNEVEYWVNEPERGAKNVALRLPEGVVGVDVDAYGEKRGRETLAELEAARGALPPTWVSGSRDDGASGIRFYTVPLNWQAPPVFGAGIECISWHYRYAVAWPSIHPETGLRYKWRRLPGWESCDPPAVNTLPSFPESWLDGWQHASAVAAGNVTWDGTGEGEHVDIDVMIQDGAGPSGGQRHQLLRLTQKLAGINRSEVEALAIWRMVIANTEQDGADPWTDDHFYDFFHSAQGRADASRQEQQVDLPSDVLTRWAETAGRHREVVATALQDTAADDGTAGAGGNAGAGGDPIISFEWLSMEYTCDHFGMAEFFTNTYGNRVRWDEQLQSFMVHVPQLGRWCRDGKKHERVTRMVRQLAKLVYQAAEEEITTQDIIDMSGRNGVQARDEAERRVNGFRRWYNVFKGAGNTYSVVGAIQPTAEPCHTTDFNKQPHLLNFPNGTYDVTTGQLRAHDPGDMLAHQVTVPLNLELMDRSLTEVAPYFNNLLKRMCAADDEVPAEVAASRQEGVQSWFGGQLHGSNPEKRLGVLQGATQIGKNQAVEVICVLLGDEIAWPAARPQLLVKSRNSRHDAEESDLAGKRMVLVNELLEDQFLDESQVLRLVNPEGTMVSLRRMGHDRVDAITTWKITVTTNALPQADVTPQVASRLLIMQLSKVEIPPAERWDIKRAILENESEAVVAHLVKWWREWYLRWTAPGAETGFIIPEESGQAIEDYREDNRHPAEMFIEERLMAEPSGYITSREVWEYCDAYYRTQHSDKDRRYLGGRRKLYSVLEKVPGVTRFERSHGQKMLLLGFQGIRLIEGIEEQLRLLEARGSGRDV
jgi:P4 family phage/plasmid primase-like protien